MTYSATGTTFTGVPDGTYNLYDSPSNRILSNLSVAKSGSSKLDYYTVSFDTDGGSDIPSQVIYTGQDATVPTSPTKTGSIIFGGWVTAQAGSTAFTFTGITSTQTAWAKWISVSAGTEIPFAGSGWRILKVNGNKALIIKIDALTELEAYGSGATDGYVEVPFLSNTATGVAGDGDNEEEPLGAGERDNYYFDRDGSNGYQDSGLQPGYGLKAVIDYYYNHTIAQTDDSNRVQSVNLNDPTFDKFKAAFDTNATFDNWWWGYYGGYYTDTRFATTVGTGDGFKQQAFALSFGDVNTITPKGSTESKLLNFPESNVEIFWLRSAGYEPDGAGAIFGHAFTYVGIDGYTLPIRPALWISLS
jgi:hypothetical protein